MDEEFKIFCDKISLMLYYIKIEHDSIMERYEEEKLIKKSYPPLRSDLTEKEKQNAIDELQKLINPSLREISVQIDNGQILWSQVEESPDFNKLMFNPEEWKKIIYKSWEKLLILKSIKYNLTLEFIIHAYLYFEKEILHLVREKYNDVKSKNIKDAFKTIEKNTKLEINSTIKNEFNKYRLVINVHKHGGGGSFNDVKSKHPEILNNDILTNNDPTFAFKLKMINFDDIYNLLISFILEVQSKAHSITIQ